MYLRTLRAKETYFVIKSDYSIAKVYDGYTNKEVNKNYKKFQKAAILFWNGGTSTP
jgi:GDP-D-mannose dehydratase